MCMSTKRTSASWEEMLMRSRTEMKSCWCPRSPGVHRMTAKDANHGYAEAENRTAGLRHGRWRPGRTGSQESLAHSPALRRGAEHLEDPGARSPQGAARCGR